ncbi:uncharacterized protein DMAD_02200 [Drosophila madeirensis]|uniref:Uncharacterized protein n=1 Tax=Drosophila madeirensis TaxID=30013 RepID=A0AAU9G4B9_DROMD
MKANVVKMPLPGALSAKRFSKMTEDSWRAAKAVLLLIEKQLKINEKHVEVPLDKSIAAINVKDNLPTAWQTEKTTEKTISPRLKLTNSQEQTLVTQVTDRMRLSRQRAAIIDMGLVLLTVALVSCACLWEKASLLLFSCLLLGPLSWSLRPRDGH